MKMVQSLLIIILFLSVAVACSNQNTIPQINDYLTEMMEKEVAFEKAGEKLNQLESGDHALYEEIIAQDETDSEKIAANIDEAFDLLEEQKVLLKEEKAQLKASEEIFMKIVPKLKEVNEEEVKGKLREMVDVMEERYDIYDDLHESYEESLRLTGDMYEAFQEKDIRPDQIQAQVNKVNASYEEIEKAFDDFNDKTSIFNQLKASYLSLVGDEGNKEGS